MKRRTFVGSIFAGLASARSSFAAQARASKLRVGDIPTRVFGKTGESLTIIGQAGRLRLPVLRASAHIRLISAIAVSSVRANCWCTSMGSCPSTKYGVYPMPSKSFCNSSLGMSARKHGLAI